MLKVRITGAGPTAALITLALLARDEIQLSGEKSEPTYVLRADPHLDALPDAQLKDEQPYYRRFEKRKRR